jgi:thiol:disulfide interchange protein DsbD
MKIPIKSGAALLCSLALASAEQKTQGAQLKFVADVSAIQPGVPFTVALHVRHEEGFHTYWKAPGIVGLPTMIEWKLPPGFKAGPIEWPSPELVDMASHPAHGYHRDVLLLTRITPPKTIEAKSVTLVGDLTWMACRKTCHPGFALRKITIPVTKEAKAKPHQRWATSIATERANLPGPSALWIVTLESKQDASPIIVRVRPAKGASPGPGNLYFFSADGQLTSEPPQQVARQKDGSYLITGLRSEFAPQQKETLPGILVASKGWAAKGKLPAFQVAPPFPK